MTGDLTTFDGLTVDDWAARINACWRQSVEAIIAAGRLLIEAKGALPHGEFRAMCDDKLPFGHRKAQMLMAIASDARLTANAQRIALLPPNWGALYDCTRLGDDLLEARFTDGTINPSMERKAISTTVKQQSRTNREITLGLYQRQLPFIKAGLILEDYEWDDEVYSRETGMDRHASNHYPTSTDAHSAEEIHRRRPIERIIDKRGCVLAMWTTNQHLKIAMDLMALRGFEYKSNYAWGKDKISTGRWNRSKHELMLIGTVGSPPCPAPGTQWDSLQLAPKSEHSAKPDCFYEMLEEYFPTVVKIELNARRPRAGWVQWGNESEPEAQRDDTALTAAPAPKDDESETSAMSPCTQGDGAAQGTMMDPPRQNSAGWKSPLADDGLGIPEFLRRTENAA